jgi:toxin YoeB
MSYTLDFSNQAKEDIAFHKKVGDKAILKKLLVLFKELSDHTFVGTGKPKPLKHELSGFWSRRINREQLPTSDFKQIYNHTLTPFAVRNT